MRNAPPTFRLSSITLHLGRATAITARTQLRRCRHSVPGVIRTFESTWEIQSLMNLVREYLALCTRDVNRDWTEGSKVPRANNCICQRNLLHCSRMLTSYPVLSHTLGPPPSRHQSDQTEVGLWSFRPLSSPMDPREVPNVDRC